MAAPACGSSMSTSVAPRVAQHLERRLGTPRRPPGRRLRRGARAARRSRTPRTSPGRARRRSRAPAPRTLVASAGSAPAMTRRARAPRRRPCARADRSDRATTRTRSGRSARRGRRSASGRRCRRARPAGGSIRRCRSRARAAPCRRRPRRPTRRSIRRGCGPCAQGFRVGPKAEFSVEDPIANSSQLVLPTMTAPAASSRATTVASYGGTKCSRIFDAAVVRTPRVHRLSLSATGTPASGSDALSDARSMAAARASARSARDGVERVQRGLEAPSMRASASRADLGRGAPSAPDVVSDLENGRSIRVLRSHPMTRGTLKKPGGRDWRRARSRAPRRGRATAARRPRGLRPAARRTLAVGGTPVGVDVAEPVRVVEDVAELLREQVDFSLVELEIGKRGDGLHLGACESDGHGKC